MHKIQNSFQTLNHAKLTWQSSPFLPSDFATTRHSRKQYHFPHYPYSHLSTFHHRYTISSIPMFLNITLFYQILSYHFLSSSQIKIPSQESHGSLSISHHYFLFFFYHKPPLFQFVPKQLSVLFNDFFGSDSPWMTACILLYLNFNSFSQTFSIKLNFFTPLINQNYLLTWEF